MLLLVPLATHDIYNWACLMIVTLVRSYRRCEENHVSFGQKEEKIRIARSEGYYHHSFIDKVKRKCQKHYESRRQRLLEIGLNSFEVS